MAHDIALHTSAGGRQRRSFYSLRESPWHQLGTVVDLPLADPQILQVAGLDWTPRKVPLYTSEFDDIPDHVAIKRSDDGRILGVVGCDYEPLPNAAMFDFLRQAAGVGDLTIETAGALGHGESVWALARVPDLDIVLSEDVSLGYLLISNGHIGQRRLTVQPTSIRVVCSNTLALAMSRRGGRRGTLAGGFAIRHTKGIHQALADVSKAYADAIAAHTMTVQACEYLTRAPVNNAKLRVLFDRVFDVPDAPDEQDRAAAIRRTREDRIMAIFNSPTCMNEHGGSLWAALQAVTEFVDHDRPTRAGEGKDEAAQRFASATWGSGAKLKAKAWKTALELA